MFNEIEWIYNVQNEIDKTVNFFWKFIYKKLYFPAMSCQMTYSVELLVIGL